MSDEKIVSIPVKHRDSVGEQVLELVPEWRLSKCRHTRFEVDRALAQVTCKDCGEKLDPMFALVQLAHGETKYHDLHARYQDEMGRLSNRAKTKCEHCSRMTRISNR